MALDINAGLPAHLFILGAKYIYISPDSASLPQHLCLSLPSSHLSHLISVLLVSLWEAGTARQGCVAGEDLFWRGAGDDHVFQVFAFDEDIEAGCAFALQF